MQGSMNKHILVFGAGKSATSLIEYLISEAGINNWQVTIADSDLQLAQSKTGIHANARAVAVNVEDAGERTQLVTSVDIVVSMLPPALHFLLAQDCVLLGKHLLTASYTDDAIRSLQPAIEAKKLLFICEMGLDPGIDHMSAMQLIHRIQQRGAVISSFVSHCGGLVAPESDDNPWHYKISWNPRNVVMAGKAGAVYLQDKEIKKMSYEQLFNENRLVTIPGMGALAWYPNRDSLGYIDIYQLQEAATFIRTTLRYPAFCHGWKRIIDLQLTDDTHFYNTDGMTLQAFFDQHFERFDPDNENRESPAQNAFIPQLEWLGLYDNATFINKGACTAADILQFALEKKLLLQAADKDMIIMLHQIEYLLQGEKYRTESCLIVKGSDNRHTAMAKAVGLPLGIAVKLILQGKIDIYGLHMPVIPDIYEPVLQELRQQGIVFHEHTEKI